jgi:hypothetical protein
MGVKGDKVARINEGGRPIVHDRERLAKELIEWAKLPTSVNLNGFCCSRNPPISPIKLSLFSNENEQFREALQIAKAFLAERRERMLSEETLHSKAYDMNATVYDYFMREERMAQAKYEADLKAKAEQAKYDAESLKQLSAVMDQIKSTQSDK